jgi:ubiquinone/menaquinone biosynthesis C-methylase UbiE
MDARLQTRIQRYGWDRAAAHYERYWSQQLHGVQQRVVEVAALHAGERVVDVACGTGLVTFAAADRVGPGGTVLGTDISQQMVDLAAREAPANVRLARMDAEHLDLPDGSFDVALSCLGLMYVPDSRVAIAEMRRVLRPGGRAVAAVWGARQQCGWAELFPIVDSRVKSEVCPMFFRLGTGDALAGEFKSMGFTDVRCERLSIPLQYETDEEACGAAFAGGPVAMAYSRFTDEMREQVHAEYLQSIAPYRVGAGYHVPGEFVVVAGTA